MIYFVLTYFWLLEDPLEIRVLERVLIHLVLYKLFKANPVIPNISLLFLQIVSGKLNPGIPTKSKSILFLFQYISKSPQNTIQLLLLE